jgi:hypothetical protein
VTGLGGSGGRGSAVWGGGAERGRRCRLGGLSGAATMGVGDGRGHRLGGWRHQDHMNVIGHQAPCPDGNPTGTAMLAQQLEIKTVVVVTEEHRLAPIAALGDVVRHIRHDSAAQLCHGDTLAQVGDG